MALGELLYVVLEGVDGLDLHLPRHLGEGVGQAPLDFELGVQAVAELLRFLHLRGLENSAKAPDPCCTVRSPP